MTAKKKSAQSTLADDLDQEPSAAPSGQDPVDDDDKVAAFKAFVKHHDANVSPPPPKSLITGVVDPDPDLRNRMIRNGWRLIEARNIHEIVGVLREILPYWILNGKYIEYTVLHGVMRHRSVLHRRGHTHIPPVPTTQDPLAWMDWVTSAEGAFVGQDPKLITASMAVRKYVCSKPTLMRKKKAGELKDHRPAGHAENAAVLFDDDILSGLFRRRHKE